MTVLSVVKFETAEIPKVYQVSIGEIRNLIMDHQPKNIQKHVRRRKELPHYSRRPPLPRFPGVGGL